MPFGLFCKLLIWFIICCACILFTAFICSIFAEWVLSVSGSVSLISLRVSCLSLETLSFLLIFLFCFSLTSTVTFEFSRFEFWLDFLCFLGSWSIVNSSLICFCSLSSNNRSFSSSCLFNSNSFLFFSSTCCFRISLNSFSRLFLSIACLSESAPIPR